jgi:hypothetical protein
LLLGDHRRLARYQAKLLVFQGQIHEFLIDRLLGEIETLQGGWEAAKRCLAAAQATARREELLWEVARTLEAQSKLALAQGSDDRKARARELLEPAVELYRGLRSLHQYLEHRRPHAHRSLSSGRS